MLGGDIGGKGHGQVSGKDAVSSGESGSREVEKNEHI